jgi:DNA-binding transcriptional ArsR family regulator
MPALLERNLDQLTCDAYNDDPTRVRRVARLMPPDDTFDRATIILKAMADPVRARILYALTQEALCVCELATLLDMSLPAVSHHLKLLTTAGMLRVRKQGKFACYYLRDEHQGTMLGALLAELTQPQGGGQ